ncbi:MAG: hypothetical protein JWN89_290 [Parcubacteria group bacterium]|nr:hypothetical protein [Parcubacteria group bacterium]
MPTFSIKNTTRTSPRSLRGIPFEEIKNAILGKSYELSLVFCGDALSHRLNLTYRQKDKPTNVLSFPLTKDSGEIFIHLKLAKNEVGFLFVHGLLHLKGMEHGATMEKAEQKFRKKFNV